MSQTHESGIEVVADHVPEDEQTSAWITQLEDEADARPTTVSLRWTRGQVAFVKRAAALHGVPYQTYLKTMVWRAAADDLRRAREAS